MKKTLVLLLVVAMSALAFAADESKDEKDNSKAEDRIQAAATVLDESSTLPIRSRAIVPGVAPAGQRNG